MSHPETRFGPYPNRAGRPRAQLGSGYDGGRPAAFWCLGAGTLINRLGSFVLIFLAIYLTKGRGFSDAQAGLVLGLAGAGGAVGTLSGGVPSR